MINMLMFNIWIKCTQATCFIWSTTWRFVTPQFFMFGFRHSQLRVKIRVRFWAGLTDKTVTSQQSLCNPTQSTSQTQVCGLSVQHITHPPSRPNTFPKSMIVSFINNIMILWLNTFTIQKQSSWTGTWRFYQRIWTIQVIYSLIFTFCLQLPAVVLLWFVL